MNPSTRRDRLGRALVAPALLAGVSSLLCLETSRQLHAATPVAAIEQAVDRPFDAATIRFERSDDQLVPRLDESSLRAIADRATSGRLTALRVDGAPLRFEDLPSGERRRLAERFGDDAGARYETGVARQLAGAMKLIGESNRDATMTVIGLPFERRAGDPASIAKSNGRYDSVMQAMDAVVIERNVMVAGPDDGSQLARIYPNAVSLAADKPVLYRVNGSWNARVPALPDDARAAATNGGSRDAATPMARPGGGLDGAKSGGSSGGRSISVAGGGGKASGGAPVRGGGGSLGVARGGSGGGVPAIRAGADDGSNPELDALMRAWGTNDPTWDLDGNGTVDGRDLAILLGGMTGEPDGEEEEGGDAGSGDNTGDGRIALRGSGGDEGHDGGDGEESGGEGGSGGDAGGGSEGDGSGGSAGGGDPSGGGASTIVPGPGFDGETQQPPRAGSFGDVGYERKSIARWNGVPHRDLAEPFEIGVMAYHVAGIDRVEFQLDGGEVITVTTPSLNPRTNTEEYWITIDPAVLADGHHELRAVAIPRAGDARVLGGASTVDNVRVGEVSYFFNSNGQGSLSRPVVHVAPAPEGSDDAGDGSREHPFATLMRATYALAGDETYGDVGGGEIHLLPGDHNLGTYAWPYAVEANERWMTVRPAEGVAEEDVRIVSASSGGLRVAKLHLQNVRITPMAGAHNVIRGATEEELWIDDCSIIGETFYPDEATRSIVNGFSLGRYTTDTIVKDVISTPVEGTYARNVHMDSILEDAFHARVIVDCSMENLAPDLYVETDYHSDVWQVFNAGGTVENCIMINVEATENIYAQGLFFRGNTELFKDMAFIDVEIDNTRNGDPDSIFVNFHAFEPFEHVLVVDSRFRGGGRYVEPGQPHGGFVAQDVVFCRVEHLVTGLPFLPDPDGPTSWTEGRWPGFLPWTSPSGITYTVSGPWEDGTSGPDGQPEP